MYKYLVELYVGQGHESVSGEIGVTIRFYFWNFNIICKGSIQNVVKMKYE